MFYLKQAMLNFGPNLPEKGIVYCEYHISKYFSYYEINLMKFAHPFHSLKIIFESSTKVRMTDPF